MANLEEIIKNIIYIYAEKPENGVEYRKPLVGFSDAKNHAFENLNNITTPDHLLPLDILPNAVSVVSFFLPFAEELVTINKNHDYVSKEWAKAYIETNKLIDRIIEHIKTVLATYGVQCSDNPARMPFDKERLVHRWSQRHVARICGLGNFGINNMLITDIGCAGRYGSFVINAPLNYNKPVTEEYCLYKKNGTCQACVKACPTEALTTEGFDRYKCYAWVREVDEYYADLGDCEVCGKCITIPCAFKKP